MKKLFLIPIMILVLGLLASCSSNGVYTLKVLNGGELSIGAGEVIAADVIMLGGELRIEPGAELAGSIYQFLGSVEILGTLSGNLSQFNGSLVLGPGAVIGGNLSLGGGPTEISPAAEIQGKLIEAEILVPYGELFTRDLQERLPWSIGMIILLSGLALIAANSLPAQVDNLRDALVNHVSVCLAAGFLVGLVGVTLLVQMAFTVILIPVAVLGLLVLVGASCCGWIALGDLLGKQLAGRFGLALSRPVRAGLGTAIVVLSLQLISLLPIAGDLLAILVVLAAWGGVYLTRFGVRRFRPAV